MVSESRDPALLFPTENKGWRPHACVEVLPGSNSCKYHVNKDNCSLQEGIPDPTSTCSGVKNVRGTDMLMALRFVREHNAMKNLYERNQLMSGHGHLSDERAEGSSPFPPTQVCF
jgi:hypothetical protein